MKYIFTFVLAITLLSLSSCESAEDKCRKHYIDKEGYSYDEACELCEDAYNESRARR